LVGTATQEGRSTVNTGGTLTADGGATCDVGVGTVTLAGGTLASLAASPAWGSWRFDDATDKLLVTQNSTVSATERKVRQRQCRDRSRRRQGAQLHGHYHQCYQRRHQLSHEDRRRHTHARGHKHLHRRDRCKRRHAAREWQHRRDAATVHQRANRRRAPAPAGAANHQLARTLAPAPSVGTVHRREHTTLTGTLIIEIASAASADRLNASGTVALSGPLTITAPVGLPAGTAFTILT
jgi:hypothetical protein